MRVLVVGGGPAGLYAALLLRKADPDGRVTVVERNPPDATYGWGVVFSDRTLAEFREADEPSYTSITDRFVLWDAIDIRYRDRLVRAGGQPFAGIARKTLLRILQDRCRRLGVELRFEEEVPDPGAAGRSHDLVVAADGVHSLTREGDPEAFGTRLRDGRARYIWFGTPLPLDSFTFVFRETEHGVFQSHAYPFDGTTSTWIVECHEDVWRRAGLDGATPEESIAFCEDLFAPELRGRPLLSNNSRWISFVTVRNRRWRRGNVVLVGDAAHTAHFSIGSGTKLAMEDAIALSRGFQRHPEDLDAALADYEAERPPRVERFQEAAQASQEYFENAGRYLHMDPEQFSFYLLTRSGRIDYTNLRLRDPHLVAEVDRWFAADGGTARPAVPPPPLHHPLRLRGAAIRNRVAVEVPPRYDARDGVFPAGFGADAAGAARDGTGLVLPQVVAVAAEGRITPGDPGLYDASHAEAWREVAEGVRREGGRLALRLGHAGPRAATRPRDHGTDRAIEDPAWPLLAASPLPYAPGGRAPKELTEAEMDRLVDRFAQAARWAADAGVEALLVHMAHGYLLASFLSPLTNRREDAHGGGLERRLRFPLRVFGAVRDAWPEDRPLGATVTADDRARGGTGPDEAVRTAAALKEAGCDLVEPVAGQTVWEGAPAYGRAHLAPYADRIRNEMGIPVLLGGAIDTPDLVNTLVAGGRADLCVLDPMPPRRVYAPTP